MENDYLTLNQYQISNFQFVPIYLQENPRKRKELNDKTTI